MARKPIYDQGTKKLRSRLFSWVSSVYSGSSHQSGTQNTKNHPALREGMPIALPLPRMDLLLFALVVCLLGLGVVMVYSASAVIPSYFTHGNSTYYLKQHVKWLLLGLVALTLATQLDYRFYQRLAHPLLILSIILLLGLLLFGPTINGAKRWFRFGSLSFQPSELVKISMVIYLAHWLSRKGYQLASFTSGFLPPFLVACLIALLILRQPDLGTAAILWLVTITLLFLAGTEIVYVLTVILTAAPIVYMRSIVSTSWRLNRFKAFLAPEQFLKDEGLQLNTSLMSVGSGGFGGVGLGQGKPKFFLSQSFSDYILAPIGEELGFIGIAFVLSCFAGILFCGFRTALRAKDDFGKYLAFGITSMIGYQTAINVGVALGLLPTKGLTLPFLSFGGSSMVFNLFAIGILLNISRGAPETPFSHRIERIRAFLFPTSQNRHLPGGGKKVVIYR